MTDYIDFILKQSYQVGLLFLKTVLFPFLLIYIVINADIYFSIAKTR